MIWWVAPIVLLLNIPFGYWRAGTRKFSLAWFAAIHLPVPIIVGLRMASGMGFQLSTVPVMVAAYFLGQFIGSRWWRSRHGIA